RVAFRGVVYVKAIELRDFNISVAWDNPSQTIALRSILRISPDLMNRIMGQGYSTEVQMMMFLKSNNEVALTQFPDIPKLYREEASIEGVNHDVAFCQMCVETAFLRFGGDVIPKQNNFAGLGTIDEGIQGAYFPNPRIGVRAQVQHLKAYASTEPMVQDLVDPRFRFVTRGIAPTVEQLSGRWAADREYGRKILAVLRRLYESAGLM
ncbi:MAG: glucosaminidase domain-containing protein, partial [Leptolyngbyaceae cyanobacterium bins.59]|nr:glucosaminidase domain-containing protein [Leptolyngbyaceae cyanobacterium bins.59]